MHSPIPGTFRVSSLFSTLSTNYNVFLLLVKSHLTIFWEDQWNTLLRGGPRRYSSLGGDRLMMTCAKPSLIDGGVTKVNVHLSLWHRYKVSSCAYVRACISTFVVLFLFIVRLSQQWGTLYYAYVSFQDTRRLARTQNYLLSATHDTILERLV